MRKKFSIDAKKVFAFEMTAPLQTILVAQVVKGRGGWGVRGTPLYKLYRYVPPHRVGFLRRFGLKTSLGTRLRYGFRGNYRVCERI